MSHDIVFFKNSLLGNVFGSFPKSKTPETIDFIGFPKSLPEINQKWESQKCFWENKKFVFGRISDFWEIFLGNLCFWGGRKSQQNKEVRICEKWVTKGDVKRYR